MQRKEWAKEQKDRHEDDYQPDMPPLNGGDYLIGYLFEVGPTMAGAMGAGPLTFGEIMAWRELTGVALTQWEVRVLRRLSIAYLNEQHRAEKLDCPPPFGLEARRQSVAAKINQVFG